MLILMMEIRVEQEQIRKASLVAQLVKNLPAVQETLGWEEELQGFNSWVGKIPWRRKWQPTPVFWRIPWTEEPVGVQSKGSQRAGHDGATNTHCTKKE